MTGRRELTFAPLPYIVMRSMDSDKTGSGLGLAVLVALARLSQFLTRNLRK
jgi:hypothetical protein